MSSRRPIRHPRSETEMISDKEGRRVPDVRHGGSAGVTARKAARLFAVPGQHTLAKKKEPASPRENGYLPA